MANAEHLAILKQGVEAWNEWRQRNRSTKPELEKADLSGRELCRADLIGADLRHANLSDAALVGADFLRANLYGARVYRADLAEARLTEASLVATDFASANLSGAKFVEADLTYAKLQGAVLSGADLRAAELLRAAFHRADLSDATLYGANAKLADFYKADLRRTDLREARLRGTSLRDADLTDALWGRTTFFSTDLAGAQLTGARFNGGSPLDHDTVVSSGGLPDTFLRGCGWPERLIEYWPAIIQRAIQLYSGFISYAHADPDKSFARRLHDQLQAKGIRVWRDEHELNPGDSIMAEIDRGIRLWDKTLLCCSEASLTSWWVDREIEKAIKKEREIFEERGEKVLALIPLNLDGFLFSGWEHPYKSYLTQRLAADFTGWESDNAKFEAQFEKVVRAMTVGGAKPPPPEPKL